MQTTPRDLRTEMFIFPIAPLSLVTNRSGPGLQVFLCKHHRAGKGQHYLPIAGQMENNEFGNLKTSAHLLLGNNLSWLFLCFRGVISSCSKAPLMKSQNWSCTNTIWGSKPLTRQVNLVPPQSSDISKTCFLAGISLKNNPHPPIATL